MKKGKLSRRSFFKTIGTASIAFPFISHQLISAPPSSRVRFAAFGTANMARVDIYEIISHPNVDFIAAADVEYQPERSAQKCFVPTSPRSSSARKSTASARE